METSLTGHTHLDIPVLIHPKKFRMDLETPIKYTDTPLDIPIFIPDKQPDRLGNMPLSIPPHIKIQYRSSTRA